MRHIILPTLLAALIAACSSTPTEQGAAVDERSGRPMGGAGSSGVAQVNAGAGAGLGAGNSAALKDPNNILSKRSIYFDYDSFAVRYEFKPLVQAHAKYLGQTPDARMLVQGNTDERGSREYNLALGQKRADAVKKSLTLLGAREDQVEAVSLGEERPKSTGHDDAAWAENRRADILYSGEY